MSIQSPNSEQQNIMRESNNIQFSNAQLMQKLLSPEIKALIEQLAHQTLLIDKLLLQKNNDALITLKPNPSQSGHAQSGHAQSDLTQLNREQINNRRPGNESSALPPTLQNKLIQLKLPTLIQALNQSHLPIELKSLIEVFKNADKVNVTIANNQQILIKIIGTATQPAQTNTITQINFTKVELSPSGQLILSQPFSTSPTQAINSAINSAINPAINHAINNAQQTNLPITVDLNKNIGMIASSLIAPQAKPNVNLATDFVQIEQVNGQLKENLATALNSSKTILNFIKQVENIGIQKEITPDLKNIELIKTSINEFIQKLIKITPHIQKLFEAINKPLELEKLTQTNTSENTKNLVSRLIKSGNLFENSVKQQTVKNDVNPLITPSKIPIDNKLLFNQIITQLEKLLVEINRYSEKPITASQIERVEKSLFTQVKDFTLLEKHQLETNKNNSLQKIRIQQEQLQNLVKLSQSLQGIIKNSLQQIEHNQLHSLKSEQFNLQQFLVDLPIKQNGMIDSFEMRFESQGENYTSGKNKYWKVVVRFDLEPLGPMFAEIQFENQKISTHIFAEKKETAQLINQHLPTLKKSLFSAGVDINKVSGSQGNIPDNLKGQENANIDTHA